MPRRPLSRRDFVKASALAGAGFWIGGRGAWAQDGPAKSAADKLNVAFVGTANRAGDDLNDTFSTGLVNVVGLCDVDGKYLASAAERHAKAETFDDWRVMFDKLKNIDAVVVATPDHTHAAAAAAAIRLGKHCYCEKPLTHTVREARVVAELAAKQKVVTQMGTQIHAGGNYRRVVEMIKGGAIGPVTEVHVWCEKNWGARSMPDKEVPVPAHLNYDLWVGPAPFRAYNPAWVPGSWRKYWAYGDGTLGDMACHYMDLPFWALDLAHPTKIGTEGPEVHKGACPEWLIVHWEFPARGELPPVKLSWYDGGKRPEKFADYGMKKEWGNGVLFVGAKGQLFADYGSARLLPEQQFKGFTPPPKSIPDSIGHHKEWVTACLKNDPSATTCKFDYAGPLSESVLLGNVAYRAGKTIEWDAKNFKATNAPEAEQLLHYAYRQGWEL